MTSMYPSTTIAPSVSVMLFLAKFRPYNELVLLKSGVSGEFRYFGWRFPSARPPKQTHPPPTSLGGDFVGSTKPIAAVIDEARLYRMHGIVLNVIMLDDDPQLKEMAKKVAKENLGRVAYVDPQNLGEAVVEDYLSLKSPLTG